MCRCVEEIVERALIHTSTMRFPCPVVVVSTLSLEGAKLDRDLGLTAGVECSLNFIEKKKGSFLKKGLMGRVAAIRPAWHPSPQANFR